MTILITGVAGFIGSAAALKLTSMGKKVIGIDNLSEYYDIELKKNRLNRLQHSKLFNFYSVDIVDRASVARFFSENKIEIVLHFAAQPGVRYSITNPHTYIDSNLIGFANILEACRQSKIKHFVFASSSSVYGANTKLPFSETDSTDQPISLYGATKKANELMAHSYAHLYNLPCTGLRFFTVYGPWGRPDMALFNFTHNILGGKSISLFNNGNMVRDFTYIDDIAEGIIRIIDIMPEKKINTPCRIYNIGNNKPVQLNYLITLLEGNLGKRAKLEMHPKHAADMQDTHADVSAFEKIAGKLPHTPIEIGIARFVEWYRNYYKVTIDHEIEAM